MLETPPVNSCRLRLPVFETSEQQQSREQVYSGDDGEKDSGRGRVE